MTAFPSIVRPVAAAVRQAISLRDYQLKARDEIYAYWAQGFDNVLAVLPTGAGKCLGKGTPVMKYDGQVVPVEDIAVGDLLMGPDSSPRRVLSLARGRESLYRIRPTKGDAYVVNESHILSLRRTAERAEPQYPCERRAGEIVNLSVREYLQKSKNWRHIHKGYRAAVDFVAGPDLPLPAYIIGAWLGDGTTGKNSLTTGDNEVAAEFEAYAQANGMRIRYEENSQNSVVMHLQHATCRHGRAGSPFGNGLRALGIFAEKDIPLALRTASRRDRLELLAGLLDTDGHYSGKGFDLILKSEKLLDGAVFIARSLGFSAYKSNRQKTCTNNGVVGQYFACTISGNVEQIPCRIARKKAAPRLQKKDVLNVGIQVEALGEGDYYGFTLDGDRLFLLGDFTVTHNTVLFSSILADHRGAALAIAHRQELVGQISMALNSFGVRHRIIAPQKTIQLITARHLRDHKVSYYDPGAMIGVAGVASLANVNKKPQHQAFIRAVTLWVQDEAHHVLKGNSWGNATMLFGAPLIGEDGKPHETRRVGVKGLGVTASPKRADGRGLSRNTDGLFDAMVLGPTMRDLINAGFLTPYQIRSVPCLVDYGKVAITAQGEYSHAKLVAAEDEVPDLVGDIVGQYLKYAPGKRGVTFVSGVKRTIEVAEAFNAAGVPAMALDGTTDDTVRDEAIRKLERGELLQLVNCDLFGEGFDLPAIEVISMGTKTASLARYIQWFGRVLRLMLNDDEKRGFNQLTDEQRRAVIAGSAKPYGLVIDHGANLIEHDGPPDIPRVWALGRYGKRGNGAADNPGYRVCANKGLSLVNPALGWLAFREQGWSDAQLVEHGHAIDGGIPCVTPYSSVERLCPACGYMPKPISRSDPQHVDGDLVLLDEETLAELFRAKAEALAGEQEYWDALSIKKTPHVIAYKLAKDHRARGEKLGELREAMGLWGGLWKSRGDTDSQMQRRFNALFRVDVLTAQASKREDAEKLTEQIWAKLALDGVAKPL